MGRRKSTEGGLEIDTASSEKIEEVVASASDGRVAYIKNGVTRLHYPADEKELFDQGWKRK